MCRTGWPFHLTKRHFKRVFWGGQKSRFFKKRKTTMNIGWNGGFWVDKRGMKK
jgi:hypothetical protein